MARVPFRSGMTRPAPLRSPPVPLSVVANPSWAGVSPTRAQLVCEYIGELVTRELAQKREKTYAALGLFYLHDIHGQYEKTTERAR